jgi:hypothetical protein
MKTERANKIKQVFQMFGGDLKENILYGEFGDIVQPKGLGNYARIIYRDRESTVFMVSCTGGWMSQNELEVYHLEMTLALAILKEIGKVDLSLIQVRGQENRDLTAKLVEAVSDADKRIGIHKTIEKELEAKFEAANKKLGELINSIALLVLKAQGIINFDEAVFADPGAEQPETYEYWQQVVIPFCFDNDII